MSDGTASETIILKMNKLYRILLLPFGLIVGLCRIANDGARIIMYRFKYGKSVASGATLTDDCRIDKTARVRKNCTVNHVSLGAYSYIGEDSKVQNAEIGNYCSIAPNVIIGPGRHPLDRKGTSPVFYTRNNALGVALPDVNGGFIDSEKTVVGNDVWIGTGAILLDGVKIGNGAVVGASSVVTKDVPDFAIVAGVPAKVIRYRDIQDSSWYNSVPEELRQ